MRKMGNKECRTCRYGPPPENPLRPEFCIIHRGFIGIEHIKDVLAWGDCEDWQLPLSQSPKEKK